MEMLGGGSNNSFLFYTSFSNTENIGGSEVCFSVFSSDPGSDVEIPAYFLE